MRNHFVTLEIPPAAHALLLAIALEDGHDSVPLLIHSLVVDEVRAFCAALSSEVTPELSELFAIHKP